MATTPTPPNPNIPEVVYGMFCGGIEQATSQKFVNTLAVITGAKVKHIHLLFQTAGGYVGDGVFLYNLFRSISVELTLYNVGQISSAGVIAFLGAKNRRTTRNATFMLHRSTNSPQFATASKLEHVAKSLVLDDERSENIVRAHVKFPPELWTAIQYNDLYLSGEEAIKYGLAHEIGEFTPTPGQQVFNVLG